MFVSLANKFVARKAKLYSKLWLQLINANSVTSVFVKRWLAHLNNHVLAFTFLDDLSGKTLVSANTTEADLRAKPGTRANVATAIQLGKIIAQRGSAKNITKVVFDRGGFKYHGKVKALADAAREGGFQF